MEDEVEFVVASGGGCRTNLWRGDGRPRIRVTMDCGGSVVPCLGVTCRVSVSNSTPMPISLRDWLPEEHFAWFVLEAVEQLDLSAFHAAYRDDGWGRQAYDPAMMLALLLYAYCEGERSSRRIERRCREDIAFRVLSANQQPDHATICRFRQRHEQALAGLFVEVLRLCAEAGLAPSGRGGAGRDQAAQPDAESCRCNRTAAQLEAEVGRMLPEAEQADAATETRLREREQKDARGRQPKRPESDPDTKVNLSDPDSRIVRDYWGHHQGDNGQAVATQRAGHRDGRADPPRRPMCRSCSRWSRRRIAIWRRWVRRRSGSLLADAGYYSDANVRSLAEAGPELLIASRNDHNRRAAGRGPARAHPGQTLDPRAGASGAERSVSNCEILRQIEPLCGRCIRSSEMERRPAGIRGGGASRAV